MDEKPPGETVKSLTFHIQNIMSTISISSSCEMETGLFSKKEKRESEDSNVPAVTAGLEMLTVNATLSTPPSDTKRKLRTKICRIAPNEILKRRCSLKPQKRSSSEMEKDEEDIKRYYLDKKIKKQANNLETIYEEKDDPNENFVHMSAKRYRRVIQFDQQNANLKVKKRRAKIKKVFGSKINFKKRGRINSMQMLLEKLNSIRSESPVRTGDTEVK